MERTSLFGEQEVDYGNSIQTMARKVMKQKQRKSEQHEQDRNTSRNIQSTQQEMELNSSDEEQQEALGSLWTSMTQQQTTTTRRNRMTRKRPMPTIFTIGITTSWDLMHHEISIYKTFIILVRHVLWAKVPFKSICRHEPSD